VRLHQRNLGHPRNDALAELLESRRPIFNKQAVVIVCAFESWSKCSCQPQFGVLVFLLFGLLDRVVL
jgi:hypothetical protein